MADPKPKPKRKPVKVPFPRRSQPPTEAEFVARLPLASGKKFEVVRTFLMKQKGVSEELYYYGPKTGWAYRYMRGAQSVATVMIHEERLMAIVSLEAAALAAIDWTALSPVGQQARKLAHGSPSLLWLDLPLEDKGANDFKVLLKAKLKAMAIEAADDAQTAPAGRVGVTPPPPPPPRVARRA